MSFRPLVTKVACRAQPLSLTAATTTSTRSYAVQTAGKPSLEIFNRRTKRLQKDRAARNVEQSRRVDYLKDEVAKRLCGRLLVSLQLSYHSESSMAVAHASCDCRISKGRFPTSSISAPIAAILPAPSQLPTPIRLLKPPRRWRRASND
jgi:hypothetical protein